MCDAPLSDFQEVVNCAELRKAPLRPLVNRCACGCGQTISANRHMKQACWDAAIARLREERAKA